MKRIAFLFIVISTFVMCTNIYNTDTLVENCSTEELTTRSMAELTPLERDITTMLELGLDTTSLLIRDDYYIADGICVPQSVLEEVRNLPDIGSRMTQNETINKHYHKVYYKLPFDESHELYQATAAAVFRWGSISDSSLETDCGFHERYDNTFYQIEMLVNNFYSQFDPLVFPIYSINNAPYQTVVININNPLWQVALDNNQYMYLVMHAIGESLKFDSVDTYSIYEPSIMMSEDLLEDHPNLWCDFTASDITAIANAFPKQDEPRFTYQWTPNVEVTYEQVCLLTKGANYTLTITSNATCCTSSTGTTFGIEIKKSGSTSTNGIVFNRIEGTGNKFNVRIDNEGQYELTAWVSDSSLVSSLHQQTIELSVLGGIEEFVFNTPDTMLLQTPYTVSYIHTAHPARTVEYSISEILFDNGSGENATLVQSGDSCMVSLNKYGCYILNAIIKENGQAVDTTYINMTKMLFFPDRDRTTILLDETNGYSDMDVTDNLDTLSSHSYYLIMPPISKYDRFACYVESEYEIRNNFSEERRIDRRWFLKLNPFRVYEEPSTYVMQIAKRYPLPTLYKIANTEPTIEGFARWRHEYYTARLYMPIDGIRMVNGMSALNQPLGYIDIQAEGFTPTRVGFGFEKEQ